MELLDEYMIDDILEYMSFDKLKIALCYKKYLRERIKLFGEYYDVEHVLYKLLCSFDTPVYFGEYKIERNDYYGKILFYIRYDLKNVCLIGDFSVERFFSGDIENYIEHYYDVSCKK